MRRQSIRWRLPLTYAGIALLTALTLGGILSLILRDYYTRQEQAYLERNAVALRAAMTELLRMDSPPAGLEEHIRLFALLSRTRVRLYDQSGQILADSGDPKQSEPAVLSAISQPVPAVSGEIQGDVLQEVPPGSPYPHTIFMQVGPPDRWTIPVAAPQAGDPQEVRIFYEGNLPGPVGAESPTGDVILAPGTMISVIPLTETVYGFELQGELQLAAERSSQVLSQPLVGADGATLGTIELSAGPAFGAEIVQSVLRGWLLAGLLAVVLAAGTGWWISQRMVAPVVALTEVTRRMAQGDLTARAEVQRSDEFGVLGQSFNQMAVRISENLNTLKRFVADAAHELNTPLTALRTNLELAESELPHVPAALLRANQQVERMEQMAASLLDLSRLESEAAQSGVEPVNLVAVVQLISELFASRAEQLGLDFSATYAVDQMYISGRLSLIQRAISNILDNAVKFTPPPGSVQVWVGQRNQMAIVQVQDTGIGIQPGDEGGLFSRFHRGKNAAGYPGSGLGLAIVLAIVEQYGGQVRIQRLEQGSLFELLFPMIQMED